MFAFDLKTTLPAPCSVFLSGYQLRVAHIDWSTVTRADISGLTVRESLKMLRLLPGMRECTLHNIHEENSVHQLHGNLVHTNLITLDVYIITDQISLFFDHLTAPSLKELRNERSVESLKPIMTFLRRSSCPLSTLTLIHEECAIIHDRELLELLGTTPTLYTLKIYDLDAFDGFFELLDQPNSHDEESGKCLFLPSLTHLFMDCRQMFFFL
ncbi:hypothetical protein NLJ89_g7810 [Agrocybe chaxingu]|uniref:Uncharacterized protein n=1 Tax=Agrocybe chaxingu TaxID=84603 RepID=A0A9W8K2X7_9AGAR|nr:hypothetical protein NLJ89_g7810 [Agrocybe chaxingu]